MKHQLLKHKLMLRPVLFLALGLTAHASSRWYVDGVNGSDSNNCKSPQTACKTIGHAISLASSRDSIKVAAATYKENLTIGLTLKVIGSGAKTTIVDGSARGTVVTIPSATSKVTLSNLTIQDGSANNGAGVNNAGTLTIFNSTIFANAASNGGGIYNAGTLTIRNSNINSNSASDGGGISGPGTAVTIFNSTIYGNSASNGGGVNSGGTLTISNSVIGGNSGSNGGGIGDPGSGGTATISNSTIYGNSASNGGGIYNTSRTLTISNSTFGYSSAFSGDGIYNAGPTATFQNSIVAYPNGGPNCFGPVTSNGYNLSSDDTCNFHSTGDLINTDPKLGFLHDNGGPTQTMAEKRGSPAIDAGNPSGCTDGQGHLLKTDQRGRPRHDKEDTGGCDMGAYERQKD
jgi:hypothetical protein